MFFKMRHLRTLLGDPKKVARELRDFETNVRSVDTLERKLVKKFPNMCVAFVKGRLVAVGKVLSTLLEETDKRGISRKDLYIRFLEDPPRTLILGAKSD